MPGKPGRPRKHPLPSEKLIAEPVAAHIVPVSQLPVIETELSRPKHQELHPSDLAPREQARQDRGDTTRQGTGREKRVPLGVPVQRLQADVPAGMVGRWTNDTPGRIERARQGGYEFISSDGDVIQDRSGARSEIVGTGRDGGAMRAFLMAIPTVLYEEDQAAKAALIKEGSEAIQRGEPQQAAAQDEGAFYTPSEGIKLRDEVR